mmetsp:Transcript_10217/g.26014  ORF Transcript_10217/g.26014 Transcript_10217/m.26014 type:complete len:248 (-) Transcript_10217:296-1039(-)
MTSLGPSSLRVAAVVAAAGAGLALVAWPAGTWALVARLEKPRYSVARRLAGAPWWALGAWREAIELREYSPYLVAEVEVADKEPGSDDLRASLGAGFSAIAGYIFGKNTRVGGGAESEKIAMTSPVAAEMLPRGGLRVSFMMPSKYSLDTLPVPHNADVVIKEKPASRMAAIRWRGRSPDRAKVAAMLERLGFMLAMTGEIPHGDPMLWQYHPPFAPGWVRQNEVLLRVGKLQSVTRNYPVAEPAAS